MALGRFWSTCSGRSRARRRRRPELGYPAAAPRIDRRELTATIAPNRTSDRRPPRPAQRVSAADDHHDGRGLQPASGDRTEGRADRWTDRGASIGRHRAAAPSHTGPETLVAAARGRRAETRTPTSGRERMVSTSSRRKSRRRAGGATAASSSGVLDAALLAGRTALGAREPGNTDHAATAAPVP
jgi:hypothetical protein